MLFLICTEAKNITHRLGNILGAAGKKVEAQLLWLWWRHASLSSVLFITRLVLHALSLILLLDFAFIFICRLESLGVVLHE
jgi:hypothetical protein